MNDAPTCLVLFDGGGLARLGIERAGWRCTGVDLNPVAHHLSTFVGDPEALVLGDVRDVDPEPFDAIWMSPPCQHHSSARTQGPPISAFSDGGLLAWSLELAGRYPEKTTWVECVPSQERARNRWGTLWNAAQFGATPLQCRNRLLAGHHPAPSVERPYRRAWNGVCPAITATEYKGCASDSRRASRFYGRRLTLEECAFHQGFEITETWRTRPAWYRGTPGEWTRELYTAIGNGVPVYMAEAFGRAALSVLADVRRSAREPASSSPAPPAPRAEGGAGA